MSETIELGKKVRDKVTGFEGIATAKVEYLNRCVQYCVEAKVGEDGKKHDPTYIDVDQLEVIGEGLTIDTEPSGGAMPNQPPGLGR